jgi:hypothetical protein
VNDSYTCDRPAVPPVATCHPLPPGWAEYWDVTEQLPYYHNTKNNTTTWDRPFVKLVKPAEEPVQGDEPVNLLEEAFCAEQNDSELSAACSNSQQPLGFSGSSHIAGDLTPHGSSAVATNCGSTSDTKEWALLEKPHCSITTQDAQLFANSSGWAATGLAAEDDNSSSNNKETNAEEALSSLSPKQLLPRTRSDPCLFRN